jgi:hypothetical protein
MAAYLFNLEPALGVGMVLDDAVRDRLVEGWNGTISTLDDVRSQGAWRKSIHVLLDGLSMERS